MTNEKPENDNLNHSAENLEGVNHNISKLQQIHEEYITRFKFMCGQIEDKFFGNNNTFFFGSKASLIDYVFYQELLSAMILSGHGTRSEFLSEDTEARMSKLSNLTNWYREMSERQECKSHAVDFLRIMT